MKWFIFLLLLFPPLVSADIVTFIQPSTAAFSCDPYDPCQHFEGAGYDNSETWTENLNEATINEDYTTNPGEGAQSLYILDGGTDGTVQKVFTVEHADGATTGVHFMLRIITGTALDNAFFKLMDGLSIAAYVYLDTEGYLSAQHGTVARTNGSTNLETAATWFHVWAEWTTANGGSNGTLAVYISATGTKPGSPEINITNGDGDYPGIDRIEFKAVGQICFVVDQVLVDNAAIGNVP